MSGAAAGHAIEYFATLGRKKLVCKSFQCSSSNGGCGSSGSSSSSSQHQKNPAFIWNEAITDIVIIHAGETIPEEMRDWEMVQASVDNSPTGLTSMIAFQRRSASQRLDHITKVERKSTLYDSHISFFYSHCPYHHHHPPLLFVSFVYM